MLGGIKNQIDIDVIFEIKDTTDDLIKKIKENVDASYKQIKLKIKPGKDIDILKKVRRNIP